MWCGYIYSKCCLHKADKEIHPKERERLSSELLRKSFYKTCLHPNKQECSGKAIGAHALQNNRILSKLEVDKHVMMIDKKSIPECVTMDDGEKLYYYKFDKKCVNEATKYHCFCKDHDDAVFKDIEKDGTEYIIGNKKQEFLFAYKSFAFEFYLQSVKKIKFQKHVKILPSILHDYKTVFEYRTLQRKSKELLDYKEAFDNILINGNYQMLNSVMIEFDEEIIFANFSCFIPRFTIDGKKIRKFFEKVISDKLIFFTIYPSNKKSYLIISYFEEDYKLLKPLIRSFRNSVHNLLKFYFNTIFPIYSKKYCA